MTHVKYVLDKTNKNLSKQSVDIKYVKNVLNNWLKIINVKNAQYVKRKIGLNLMNEF